MSLVGQKSKSPEYNLDQVKSFIHHHTSEVIDREQLANLAGYSVPHFHRIFTAETGENIVAYVRRVRLERAAQKLMMGAVDLTEVALAAGYQSHTAFSKAFKQRFGHTPSSFRKLNYLKALQIIKEGKSDDQD